MKTSKYKELIPQIKEIIALSDEVYQEEKEKSEKRNEIIKLAEVNDYIKSKEDINTPLGKLINYLNKLDFEELQIVASIMLTGRETGTHRPDKEFTKSEITEMLEENFNINHNSKNDLIEYITAKLPLNEYLRDGLDSLNKII